MSGATIARQMAVPELKISVEYCARIAIFISFVAIFIFSAMLGFPSILGYSFLRRSASLYKPKGTLDTLFLRHLKSFGIFKGCERHQNQ